MDILLLADGESLHCTEHGACVIVNPRACPKCGARPWRVRGATAHPSTDGRAYEATAACVDCGQVVGRLRVETGTLFGVAEDEAVLCGRWRVY